MAMEQIGQQQNIVIRMLRLWMWAREDGEATLARMYEVASNFGLPDQTAPSCASLFTLVESALGRALVSGPGCASKLSADETALLGVIEAAPTLGAMRGSAAIPHGLPGAIRWAAMCVRDSVGWPTRLEPSSVIGRISGRTCPFATGLEVDRAA